LEEVEHTMQDMLNDFTEDYNKFLEDMIKLNLN
jgi:hypothetical protein